MKKLVLLLGMLLWFPLSGAVPMDECDFPPMWEVCDFPGDPPTPPPSPPTPPPTPPPSTPPTFEEADAELAAALDQYLVEAYQLAGATLSADEILADVIPQLEQQAQARQAQFLTGLTIDEEVDRMKFRLVEAHHPDFANGIPQSFQDLMDTVGELAIERQLATGGAP